MNRKNTVFWIVLAVCLFLNVGVATAAVSDADFFSLCARGSALDVYKAIIAGANVNARSDYGRTPLFFTTVEDGRWEIVALLLLAGADPWAEDFYGNTFFYYSEEDKARSLVSDFIKKPADARALASQVWRKYEKAVEKEQRDQRSEKFNSIASSIGQDSPEQNQLEGIRAAAESGAAMSQYMLAAMYDTGDGVNKDANEAVRWYEKASAQGHTMAMNRLGEMYRDGVGVARDEGSALALFARAADGGYGAARANLADLKAAKFMELCSNGTVGQVEESIENGSDVNLRDGRGHTPLMRAITAGKTETAVLLLEKGADVNVRDDSGKTALDYAFEKSGRDTELYRRLQVRQLQFLNASVGVNTLFSQGTKAYDAKDYNAAFKFFSDAAEAGHVWSAIRLGEMYFNAEGVEKDDGMAFYWMRVGAEEGHARTQYNLGYLCETGQGTKQDNDEALRWYIRAAENGYEEAAEAIVALGGTPPEPLPSAIPDTPAET